MISEQLTACTFKMAILLPLFLLEEFLCEWLDLRAVGRLDSAFCVREIRQDLLIALASQAVSEINATNVQCTAWLVLRKITAVKVAIKRNYDLEESLVSEFLTNCQSNMISLHIQSWAVSDHIREIVGSCGNLTSFRCRAIAVQSLCLLLRSVHGLQSVHVNISESASTSCVAGLSLPNLVCLKIKFVHEGNVAIAGALASQAPNLQKLMIENYCYARTTPLLTSPCMHLRSLGLHQVNNHDVDLATIVVYCPHILHLDLSYCHNLTDEGVLLAARYLNLSSINLSECRWITDESLRHLMTHCKTTLEELYLSATILQLRQECTALIRFRLVDDSTDRFNPRSLETVTRESTSNVVLISYLITDQYIHDVVVAGDGIEILCLYGCYSETDTDEMFPTAVGLSVLCSKWPNLHTIVVREAMYADAVEAARDLPQLTVTSDTSVYMYDLMSMPI